MRRILLCLFALNFAACLALKAHSQAFSSDWQKVPLTFQGNDAKAITQALLKNPANFTKSEFETTEAFKKRMANAAAISIGPNLTADKELVFRFEPKETGWDEIDYKYDADKAAFFLETLVIDKTWIKEDSDTVFLPALPVAPTTYQYLGTYVGTNAFGVKTKITKNNIQQFLLAFRNYIGFSKLTINETTFASMSKRFSKESELALWYEFSPTFKADAETARRGQGRIAFLYVCKLASPYLVFSSGTHSPTIDEPSDGRRDTAYLVANVSEIWIFNKGTGEILSKLRSGDMNKKAEPAPTPVPKPTPV